MDSVLILMLAGGIGLGIKLHFSMMAFNQQKEEFVKILDNMASSITKIKSYVEEFQHISGEEKINIRHAIEKATTLRDELSFITEFSGDILKKMDALPAPKQIEEYVKSLEKVPAVKPTHSKKVQDDAKKKQLLKTVKEIR